MHEKEFIENMKKTMDELYRFNFRLSLFNKLLGVDFSRCFERSLAAICLKIQKGQKLLDVGSGKSCFPLFMVKKGAVVTCLDIDERVMVQKKYAKKVGIINHPIKERFNIIDNPKMKIQEKAYTSNDGSFNVIVGDVRKTDFSDSTFDFVTCISTIEHIPGDGDIMATKEFERILKPGGKAFISVPYRQKYKEGVWGRWFQRDYNYDALQKRLIQSSGLIQKDGGFLIDYKTMLFSDIIYHKLPRLLRFAFQWSHYFFAKHYVGKDDANKDDAWVAWLLLEKRSVKQ